MKTKRVTRYMADCGKGFWDKSSCLYHESKCKCWTNAKNRTCKTCHWASEILVVSNVICDGKECFQSGGYQCNCPCNKAEEHSGAPEGVTHLSVGCIYHNVRIEPFDGDKDE